MITVAILINGQPIFTRTAVNRGNAHGFCEYEVDDGKPNITHKRSDGAVKLAIKMLQRIKEQK